MHSVWSHTVGNMAKAASLPNFDVTLSVSRNPTGGQEHDDAKALVCRVKKQWTVGKLDAKVLASLSILIRYSMIRTGLNIHVHVLRR